MFEKSGFLTDNILNKEAYRNHLHQWSESHEGWSEAVEKAIKDCVDKDLRQYLSYPCRAYDVFTCTGIAMLKVSINKTLLRTSPFFLNFLLFFLLVKEPLIGGDEILKATQI